MTVHRAGLRHCIGLILSLVVATAAAEESTCFGTTGNGRLENARKLPESGTNFAAYSTLGAALGRTYVHSRVERTVVAAYRV